MDRTNRNGTLCLRLEFLSDLVCVGFFAENTNQQENGFF